MRHHATRRPSLARDKPTIAKPSAVPYDDSLRIVTGHTYTHFFPSDCDIIIPTTEDCIRLQNPSPLVEDVLILVIRSQTEYSFFSHSELFLANNSIPSISHITKGAWLSSGRISPSLHLYVFNPSANNGELSQGSRRRHFLASGKCSYSPRIF